MLNGLDDIVGIIDVDVGLEENVVQVLGFEVDLCALVDQRPYCVLDRLRLIEHLGLFYTPIYLVLLCNKIF